MKKIFINLFLLFLSAVTGWYSTCCITNKYSAIGIFVSGLIFGIFLMNIKLNVKDDKLNTYKRELEKESISSSESDAKVKILAEKIKV